VFLTGDNKVIKSKVVVCWRLFDKRGVNNRCVEKKRKKTLDENAQPLSLHSVKKLAIGSLSAAADGSEHPDLKVGRVGGKTLVQR
jgi:hypothetical protein